MHLIHPSSFSVLLVDDEPEILNGLRLALLSGGINHTILCEHAKDVMSILESQKIGVVLLDLWMPDISGQELLPQVMEAFPDLPVIVVTGINEVDTAVACMKNGAFDYLVKPVEKDQLVNVTLRAIELHELRKENARLKHRVLSRSLDYPEAFSDVVTTHPSMLSIFQYLEAIATSRYPVLITGETGVGKELIARALHTVSRVTGPFVAVNSAGLDDNIFADTLFGHKKGAFTGAEEQRKGMIEQAQGGTLFLDEIGELSIASQLKLLRLLQERQYFPLGSDMPKRMNARVVVATNQNLAAQLKAEKFRKDLFYRLRTHQIQVPPLRERREDIPILLGHILEKTCREMNKKKPKVPKELYAVLAAYAYPGNVRELEAMIVDALANHHGDTLPLKNFLAATKTPSNTIEIHQTVEAAACERAFVFPKTLPTLRNMENLLVQEAMERANNNQTVAARTLGISRQALNRRLHHKKS